LCKHAGITTARLALERQGPAIHLEVEDCGCGFETTGSPSTSLAFGEHIGLRMKCMSESNWLVGILRCPAANLAPVSLVVAEVQLLPCDESE